MGKSLYITEKPSVAMEFAKALKINGKKSNGYIEADHAIITWCVGHLIALSYPEKYNPSLKRWSLKHLPFLPEEFKYEVISGVKKQFDVVKKQLTRKDVDTIYVCTDSGREGEYIYRLIDQMIGVKGKVKKRVWIHSQTDDEIRRGIQEAKSLEEYDALSHSAYLRAIEDYLAGINFSRLMTLKYGRDVGQLIGEKKAVIAVGRVMSCVLGMIVNREREIRAFVPTPFYRIEGAFHDGIQNEYRGEWKSIQGSSYYLSEKLFNEQGFKTREDADKFVKDLKQNEEWPNGKIEDITIKEEKKSPPLLFNLAELQNECAKYFKISPDQTLAAAQHLYEKKLLTYPRTDARVLSKSVAKEIYKNLQGIEKSSVDLELSTAASTILKHKWHESLIKSKYVNDTKITDHYAIIPTGQGLNAYGSLKEIEKKIYVLVMRRFLAVFFPPAVYKKVQITTGIGTERFFTSEKILIKKGYLEILSFKDQENDQEGTRYYHHLKKGQKVTVHDLLIKEGETTPPKAYTSGSIILAMENAGKLIEDEELREQIKGSGIGTSATRAEIINKLERIKYIHIHKKNQIIEPTGLGELIFDALKNSLEDLLNPELTANWEKGLEMVASNEMEYDKYLQKLNEYVKTKVMEVLGKKEIKLEKPAASIPRDKEPDTNKGLGKCPICQQGEVIKNSKGYGCSLWKNGCKFFIGDICRKKITESQVKKLISKGKTDLIKGFTSKKGTKFSARLVLQNGKIEFSFDQEKKG
ncbi:MAG: DNA topoisomerase III [Bacillota bacterium]